MDQESDSETEVFVEETSNGAAGKSNRASKSSNLVKLTSR